MVKKWIARQGMKLYQKKFAPQIFQRTEHDPEVAHEKIIRKLKIFQQIPLAGSLLEMLTTSGNKRLEQNICGLTFRNPVGLAAGFDKGAEVFPALGTLGFGFIEIGTVTGQEQRGNPRPRIWRYPEQECLINAMGFNSEGAEKIAERLKLMRKRYPLNYPLGINIGKSKNTPLGEAHNEYAHMLELLFPYGDYFVVHVSSPNTEGLRTLQHSEALKLLLTTLRTKMQTLSTWETK